MLAEIGAALAALKTAKDFAKAVVDSKAGAALREQAIEFQFAIMETQTAIIAIQSQYQALLHEKDEIKNQLMEAEEWNSDAGKYQLTEIGPGQFVYSLKPDNQNPDPPHYLCAHCYQDKKKSILQRHASTMAGVPLKCSRCHAVLFVVRR